MASLLTVTTTMVKRGPAAAIVLTDEQVAGLAGGAKAFPVTVALGDRVVGLRLARMGGENLIGFSKAARAEAAVEIGDTVTVTIVADLAERTVEVPADLAAALDAEPAARAAFDALAYSHRKEYVRWVTEAKREQTRADRVARTVEMVPAGTASLTTLTPRLAAPRRCRGRASPPRGRPAGR